MNLHPDLQRQLAHDRRRHLTRQADASRTRRDVTSIRRQLRRSG